MDEMTALAASEIRARKRMRKPVVKLLSVRKRFSIERP